MVAPGTREAEAGVEPVNAPSVGRNRRVAVKSLFLLFWKKDRGSFGTYARRPDPGIRE
jgi:hypothetical protein